MNIDIIGISDNLKKSDLKWDNGNYFFLNINDIDFLRKLNTILKESTADYTFFYKNDLSFIDLPLLENIILGNADISHIGNNSIDDDLFPELDMIILDWHMIRNRNEKRRVSWFLTLDRCLIKNNLFKSLRYFDEDFEDSFTSFFDFGYRAFKNGFLVEYNPLLKMGSTELIKNIKPSEKYLFISKHWSLKWAKYIYIRRCLNNITSLKEYFSIHNNIGQFKYENFFQINYNDNESINNANFKYDVIIPTIGRYKYLPGAIESMLSQSIRPSKIIIVDQNNDQFRKDIYDRYDKSVIKVIKQKRNGQSLARNTGLKLVQSPFVFLFDDDSTCDKDLVLKHFLSLNDGKYDISTGVSYPPNSKKYILPNYSRFPRSANAFDTGNVLIPLKIFKKHGGLDRNYDYGPGTDSDLGTRLHLNGYRIFHNPSAIRIHYKAPIGGLRKFNSHKYNTDLSLLSAFPPATQYYYGLRYLTKKQLFERNLLQFFKSKFSTKIENIKFLRAIYLLIGFIFSSLFLPYKLYKSRSNAKSMISKGIKISNI